MLTENLSAHSSEKFSFGFILFSAFCEAGNLNPECPLRLFILVADSEEVCVCMCVCVQERFCRNHDLLTHFGSCEEQLCYIIAN